MKRLFLLLLAFFVFIPSVFGKANYRINISGVKDEYFVNDVVNLNVKPSITKGYVEYKFVVYDVYGKSSKTYFTKKEAASKGYNFRFKVNKEGKYYILAYFKRAGDKNYIAYSKSKIFTVKKKVEVSKVNLILVSGEVLGAVKDKDVFRFDLTSLKDEDSIVAIEFLLDDEGEVCFSNEFRFFGKRVVINIPKDLGFEDEGIPGVTLKTFRNTGDERSAIYEVKNKFYSKQFELYFKFK